MHFQVVVSGMRTMAHTQDNEAVGEWGKLGRIRCGDTSLVSAKAQEEQEQPGEGLGKKGPG